MKRLAVIAVLAAFFHPAHAQVSVTDAWVRATAPQQKVAGAYMTLRAEWDLRLVEVRSSLAGSAEVHETSHVDNMMRMRPVKHLELPAGKTIELKPGGYHIMLLDLKQPIKEGEHVALTLVVETKDGARTNVDVKASARPLSAHGGGHRGH